MTPLRPLAYLAPLAIALCATTAPSQDPTIAQATTATTQMRGPLAYLRGLAATADGRYWALAYHNSDTSKTDGTNLRLRIHVSSDAGSTWTVAAETRTTGDRPYGSIVTGADGRTLHVAWCARNGAATKAYDAYYASYDTHKTGQAGWNGTDFIVAKAASTTASALRNVDTPDLEVTAAGRVVYRWNTQRQPPATWSTFVRVLDNGTWSAPQRVNVDIFGATCDIQAEGETIHFCYRSNTGGYGIRTRTFDAAKRTFGAEIAIEPNNNVGMRASNNNMIAVLPNGTRHIAWANSTAAANTGKIWLSIAKKGAKTFTKVLVANDPPLRGGNFSYYSYSLAKIGNTQIAVLYSLKSESHKNLYMRQVLPTGALGPQIPVRKTTKPDAYAWVSGYRNTLGTHNLAALITDFSLKVTSGTKTLSPGRAAFFGAGSGFVTPHGLGCKATLAAQPAIGADGVPAVNGKFNLQFFGHGGQKIGIAFLGVTDAAPFPVDLSGAGMGGCKLYQNIIFSQAYQTGTTGALTLPVTLPNDPNIAGFPLHVQSMVLVSGINAFGAVMTNGVTIVAR